MKQVCRKTCQLRINDRIIFVRRGEVVEYAGTHKAMEPVEGEDYVLSPLTASFDELMEAEWELNDLRKFARENFGVALKTSSTDSRKIQLEAFLDARYRSVTAKSDA